MRTTIDIDNEVLRISKHLAQERGHSLGRVLSDLARLALQPHPLGTFNSTDIPVLPRKSHPQPVTSQSIKDLLETDS